MPFFSAFSRKPQTSPQARPPNCHCLKVYILHCIFKDFQTNLQFFGLAFCSLNRGYFEELMFFQMDNRNFRHLFLAPPPQFCAFLSELAAFHLPHFPDPLTDFRLAHTMGESKWHLALPTNTSPTHHSSFFVLNPPSPGTVLSSLIPIFRP